MEVITSPLEMKVNEDGTVELSGNVVYVAGENWVGETLDKDITLNHFLGWLQVLIESTEVCPKIDLSSNNEWFVKFRLPYSGPMAESYTDVFVILLPKPRSLEIKARFFGPDSQVNWEWLKAQLQADGWLPGPPSKEYKGALLRWKRRMEALQDEKLLQIKSGNLRFAKGQMTNRLPSEPTKFKKRKGAGNHFEELSRRDGSMDVRQIVLALQNRGSLLLHAVYLESKGSKDMVRIQPIVEKLGWNEEEYYEVESHLEGKRQLKRETLGGVSSASISLTSAGLRQVERDVQRGNIPQPVPKTSSEAINTAKADPSPEPASRKRRPIDDAIEKRLQKTKELWLSGKYDERELIELIPTSKTTLYRDLNVLEERGEIKR